MNAAELQVFCQNLDCGDPQVTAGTLIPIESKRHRRMNYMGKRRLGFGRAVLEGVIAKQIDRNARSLPPGTYHVFQCPVCGRERIYFENGELLTEV